MLVFAKCLIPLENVSTSFSHSSYSCVSGFGFSGTNACVVLSNSHKTVSKKNNCSEPFLVLLSGPNEMACGAMLNKLRSFVVELDLRPTLNEICCCVSLRKRAFAHRVAATGVSPSIAFALSSLENASNLSTSRCLAAKSSRYAIALSGIVDKIVVGKCCHNVQELSMELGNAFPPNSSETVKNLFSRPLMLKKLGVHQKWLSGVG